MVRILIAAVLLLGGTSPAPAEDPAGQSGPGTPPGRSEAPLVTIATSLGEIVVELDLARSPVTVENFLRYVRAGFYDGTIFHRVIEDFMIQGGGYTRDQTLRTPLYPPIPLESRNGLRNLRGTIAMARTAAPRSATCQFFINVVDNPFLDFSETTNPTGYTVFGRVIRGMDVVDRIRAVPVVENPTDVRPDGARAVTLPADPVVIQSVRLAEGHPASRGEPRR